MKKQITILSLACLSAFPVFAYTAADTTRNNGIFVPIAKYIEKGDADCLSAWFASKLEIDLLGNVSQCSKNQARQILRTFFTTNTPKTFTIVYESGNYPVQFAVGKLDSGGSKFRVTILVNIRQSGSYIELLKIERD